MNLYEAAYQVLKKTYLIEMAISKKEYEDKVFSMLPNIIDHFLLVNYFGGSAKMHWANELVAFSNQLIKHRYKHTKKFPTAANFMDHVKSVGYDYDPQSLRETCHIMTLSKHIPCHETNFVKMHQDVEKFLKMMANHVQTGIPFQLSQFL